VSQDSAIVEIEDIVVNGEFHVYGFCNLVFAAGLERNGIRRCDVELGAVFTRYAPGDTGYPNKLSELTGCDVPAKDLLRPGESMDLKYADFGEVKSDSFMPLREPPARLEIKTDKGTVDLSL
jgi:hypothetical protein